MVTWPYKWDSVTPSAAAQPLAAVGIPSARIAGDIADPVVGIAGTAALAADTERRIAAARTVTVAHRGLFVGTPSTARA